MEDDYGDENENDYDVYGDTRNRKGKIENGYNPHNKGFKEQRRIYYIKEKRQMQSEVDKKKNEIAEDEEKEVKSKKRILKTNLDEEDENFGNNYTPIDKKAKKKKQPKKDRVRF